MGILSNEAKNIGRPHIFNRQGLYAKVAKHALAAIDTLVELLASKNENIRLGAANSLLDKCLPDLRAVEADITPNEPMEIIITEDTTYKQESKDFLSPNIKKQNLLS